MVRLLGRKWSNAEKMPAERDVRWNSHLWVHLSPRSSRLVRIATGPSCASPPPPPDGAGLLPPAAAPCRAICTDASSKGALRKDHRCIARPPARSTWLGAPRDPRKTCSRALSCAGARFGRGFEVVILIQPSGAPRWPRRRCRIAMTSKPSRKVRSMVL